MPKVIPAIGDRVNGAGTTDIAEEFKSSLSGGMR